MTFPDFTSAKFRNTNFSKFTKLEDLENNLEKAISLTKKIQKFAYNTQAPNYASEEYALEFENLVNTLLEEANFSENNTKILEETIEVYRHNLKISQEIMRPARTAVNKTKNKFSKIFDIFSHS